MCVRVLELELAEHPYTTRVYTEGVNRITPA